MRVRALQSLLFTLLVLAACGPAPTPSFEAPAPAAAPASTPASPSLESSAAVPERQARPQPGAIFAPFPYTAEEIRASSPSGRVCRFRVHDPNGVTITRMEFADADEVGVIVRSSVTTPEGESVGETEARSRWEDLVRHASYPAGFTTISPMEITVEAGTFQARLYEVADGGGGVDLRVWFADGMAGPPVKLEDIQAGEVMVSMELIEHVMPDAS